MNNLFMNFGHGLISLCTPTDYHSYTITSKEAEIYTVSFSDSFIDSGAVRSALTGISGRSMPLSRDEITFYQTLFRKFMKYCTRTDSFHSVYTKKILEFMLLDLINATQNLETEQPNNVKSLSAAMTYILNNFNKNITLEETAKHLCMSKNWFSTCFHKEFGVTFSQYLNNVRLKHACNQLVSNNALISEIAAISGFESEKHFYRSFKKKFGITPGEYRKKHMK